MFIINLSISVVMSLSGGIEPPSEQETDMLRSCQAMWD